MESHHDLWHGRRVLVTGCTGFIGEAVTRELIARGAIVAGLVRERRRAAPYAREIREKRFHIVHGRVEDSIHLHSAMAIHEVSAIFHLATADAFGNDRGTAAVMRAAGLYHPRVPVIVTRPANGLRLAMAEPEPSVPLGIARFGEVFGPGDRRESRVVPRTISALLRGEKPRPDEGPKRDFLHVRDAARACLRLAEAAGTDCLPIDCTFRSGWSYTDREMIENLRLVLAGEPIASSESEPPTNPFDWKSGTDLSKSLSETIVSMRAASRMPIFGSGTQRKAA